MRGKVLINRCVVPSSAIAVRAAFMQLASADLETIRPIPNRRNQIVPGDDAVTVFKQVRQQIEDLRLEAEHDAAAAKLRRSRSRA